MPPIDPFGAAKSGITGQPVETAPMIIPSVVPQIPQVDLTGDMPSSSARADLYSLLKSQGSTLGDKRTDLIQQMATEPSMSKAETASMLLMGLLPTLIGGAIQGKKGMAAGAQAGGVGAGTMALGMNKEMDRKRLQAQGQLESVDNSIAKNQDSQNKLALDSLDAADTASQKNLDRESQKESARIRAGGDGAIAGSIKEAIGLLRQEKLQNEVNQGNKEEAATERVFSLGKDGFAVNTGEVDKKASEEVKSNDKKYDVAIDKIGRAIEVGRSMQYGAAQRVSGDKLSKDMQRAYQEADNAWTDLKKIPGIKDTESYIAIESMLKDPTGLMENAKGVLPWTETIQQKISAFQEIVRDTRKKDFANAGYKFYQKGQMVYDKELKMDRKVLDVTPNGLVLEEPVLPTASSNDLVSK